ncbi:hypothetical protein BOX15_Mlig024099g1 [Macrostomum lignano]|uniref:EF-hand domain-containing protein n=1 Tax=Macrostomum lignano TaxID=282301 RepID=A0A267E1N2_9PLAT|nr:hypothetical protein BOX15_Mlig024099g4 [Macrostomum lignano]PAA70894.1 hypothetical protein BOX15_Mlig024099g1 [Macrostomum lignano]
MMQASFTIGVPSAPSSRPFPQHLTPHLAQMGVPMEQAMGYWNTFNHFDLDGSGTINVQEMVTGLQLMGQCPTPSDVQNMMMQADQNHDGQVDFLEYVRVTHARVQPPQAVQNDLMTAFRVFDRDGSGYLDANELRAVLCQRGMKESDFDHVMSLVDLDRDGRINYNEFAGLMTRPLETMMKQQHGKGHKDGKHHKDKKDKKHKKHKKHGSGSGSGSGSDSD